MKASNDQEQLLNRINKSIANSTFQKIQGIKYNPYKVPAERHLAVIHQVD